MMVLASVYLSGQLYKIIKIFDNNITISVNKLTQHFCHKASRGLAPLQPCLPIPYYYNGYYYQGRFIFVVFLFDKLYFCRKSPEQKLLKVLSNQQLWMAKLELKTLPITRQTTKPTQNIANASLCSFLCSIIFFLLPIFFTILPWNKMQININIHGYVLFVSNWEI